MHSVLVFDFDRLNNLSISSSVITFFLLPFVSVFCLFPVLFNLAVLFFHKPFVLIARRMFETSLVRVVIAPPSLAFLLRPRFYLLCINTNDYYYNTIFHVKGGSGKYILGKGGNG